MPAQLPGDHFVLHIRMRYDTSMSVYLDKVIEPLVVFDPREGNPQLLSKVKLVGKYAKIHFAGFKPEGEYIV